MTTPTTQPEKPLRFVYKPLLRAWIGRKKGSAITFYSYEMRNTLSQVANRGHVPIIDWDFGYQYLIHLIEEKFKGQFNVAKIYISSNINDNDPGTLLREYHKDELIEMKDPDFNTELYLKYKEKYIKYIQQACSVCVAVCHVNNKKQNLKGPSI